MNLDKVANTRICQLLGSESLSMLVKSDKVLACWV